MGYKVRAETGDGKYIEIVRDQNDINDIRPFFREHQFDQQDIVAIVAASLLIKRNAPAGFAGAKSDREEALTLLAGIFSKVEVDEF